MLGIDLNLLISIRQVDSIIHFVAWIAIGLVAGLISSRILNETRYGLGRDVLLSIFGAIVGGFFSHLLGRPALVVWIFTAWAWRQLAPWCSLSSITHCFAEDVF